MLMAFDGDRLDTQELQVKGELHFVIVDLAAQKDTVEILNRLNRCYPFAENDIEADVLSWYHQQAYRASGHGWVVKSIAQRLGSH
ncbi:MAG: hypothetical protein M9927_07770 [Anaerolineae bacterium]|nr:hypothetical protein [Anaerolineae bacterium]